VCNDNQRGDKSDRAESSELRGAEKADDDADQQVGRARNRQRICADLLNQPRQTKANRLSSE